MTAFEESPWKWFYFYGVNLILFLCPFFISTNFALTDGYNVCIINGSTTRNASFINFHIMIQYVWGENGAGERVMYFIHIHVIRFAFLVVFGAWFLATPHSISCLCWPRTTTWVHFFYLIIRVYTLDGRKNINRTGYYTPIVL